jgi:hypothetical protein
MKCATETASGDMTYILIQRFLWEDAHVQSQTKTHTQQGGLISLMFSLLKQGKKLKRIVYLEKNFYNVRFFYKITQTGMEMLAVDYWLPQ